MCCRLSYYFIHFSCFRQRSESFSSIRSHLHFRVNREVLRWQFTWKIYRSTFRWNEKRVGITKAPAAAEMLIISEAEPFSPDRERASNRCGSIQPRRYSSTLINSNAMLFIANTRRSYPFNDPLDRRRREENKIHNEQLKSNRRSISLFSLLVFLLVFL